MATINDSDKVWTELPPNRRDSDETDIQLRDIRRRLDDLEMFYKRLANQSPTGRATQGPQGKPGTPGTPGAGGVPNMIYVWHKNGKPVDFLPPDQTGLFNALFMSVGGDTVWLPSITIDMTATMTIPPGVIIRGISRQGSILSFTGAQTGIIMSALSRLRDVRVIVDGTGFTDVVGIDHTHDDAWVDAVDCSVSGGSVSNTGVVYGTPTRASEKWLATQDALYWTANYFDPTPTYSKIASLPIAPAWFGITRDGSAAYIARGGAGGVGIHDRIYISTDIHNPTPTWTLIAQQGDALGWTTIGNNFGYVLGMCVIEQNTLVTTAAGTSGGWAYGEHNGISWSWHNVEPGYGFKPKGVGFNMYCDAALNIRDRNGSIIETLASGDLGYEFLHHAVGNRYYSYLDTGNNFFVRACTLGNLFTLGSTAFISNAAETKIRGSQSGVHVYVVNSLNGHLIISDDGSSFTDVATWGNGWADDTSFVGGGLIDWTLRTFPVSPGTCVRLYNRNGTVNGDKSGNLQTLIGVGGSRNVVGTGLVFP